MASFYFSVFLLICAHHFIVCSQIELQQTATFNPNAILSNLVASNTKAFRLQNTDCFCSYDLVINLLVCSPLFENATTTDIASRNSSMINVTLHYCTFVNNCLQLPNIANKSIDELRLYDINYDNYLILDSKSFSTISINQLYIIYTHIQPLAIVLMSNETFVSSTMSSSLRKLHIESCYIWSLNQPLSRLFQLESLTLINIQQFSWYDFQKQIINLPQLRLIIIEENLISSTNDIFNVLSCQDLASQWTLSYGLIQTCSCQLLTFIQTIRRYKNTYRCLNSNNAIDFIDDICQFNGKEYKLDNNHTQLFCHQCLSRTCPKGSLCGETYDSNSSCLSLSRNNYEMLRSRIPSTSATLPYLFYESQQYLNSEPNQTLDVNSFTNVAMLLIDSNQNGSVSDFQMFHQTFSDMLDRPWASAVYVSNNVQTSVWQNLILSFEDSMRLLNDPNNKFEFQSKSLSTVSLPIQSTESFDWKITNDNRISANLSENMTITTRVSIELNRNQTCQQSNTNCTNRFSITAFKTPQLFHDTNRIPEYDVISILAPNRNQQVTFHFDQKSSSIEFNQQQTNSFYDRLDPMTTEGICMYLNTANMTWLADGCTIDRRRSSQTSVTCTCEHLTMFTVFFSSTCSTPSKSLSILTWIGCGLSIIGLSITLIVFIFISQCRQKTSKSSQNISVSQSSSSQELRRRITSKPNRLSMVKSMLFVLCILLILMNIFIFILTFISALDKLVCSILSSILYYLTLTAFIWKFFFALQQSLFLTNICQSYWSNRTIFFVYLSISLILPLCPLIIMFTKYPNRTFLSSTCSYCWLTREFLIYGLIIPILVILCLNFFFYFYTMIHLCMRNRQQPGLRSTKTERSRHMQNFKIGLFFAIIMGLSWIVGFLVLIPNSYVQLIGNIIFCILNSFQGFAFSIMVFSMLERKSFRKCFCFWRHRRQAKKSISSSTPRQIETVSTDDNDVKIKSRYSNENNQNIYSTLPI